MRTRLGSVALATLLMGVVVGAVSTMAGGATTAGRTSVTMVTEPDEWNRTPSVAREFDLANATVTASGTPDGVTIQASGGTLGGNLQLKFSPPPGARLTSGTYPDALVNYDSTKLAYVRVAGHPGIQVSGDDFGCGDYTGRFDVRDIAFSPNGKLQRLWVEYDQRCAFDQPITLNQRPAWFGEVRYEEPTSSPTLAIAPYAVTWPSIDSGATGTPVPVTVRNTSKTAVTFGSSLITGPVFTVGSDSCAGQSLRAGATCTVSVAFAPAVDGPRAGSLQLRDVRGAVLQTIQLTGTTSAGTTGWAMSSDPGDVTGGGAGYDYTPANAVIAAAGDVSHIHATVLERGSSGLSWTADFTPGTGHSLAVGTYSVVILPPNDHSGPEMRVMPEGSGYCNYTPGSFTIDRISYSPASGALQLLDLSFEQHCDGDDPALHGRIQYRNTADTTPPAKVTNATATCANGVAKLAWTNPPAGTFSYVSVRYLAGTVAPADAISGFGAYQGNGSAATVTGLDCANPYRFAIFAVDDAGNIGAAATAASGVQHGKKP